MKNETIFYDVHKNISTLNQIFIILCAIHRTHVTYSNLLERRLLQVYTIAFIPFLYSISLTNDADNFAPCFVSGFETFEMRIV